MQPVALCIRANMKGVFWEVSRPAQRSQNIVLCRHCRHCCYQTEHGIPCPRCKNCDSEILAPLGLESKDTILSNAIKRRENDIRYETTSPGDEKTRLGRVLQTLRTNALIGDLGLSHNIGSQHYSLPTLVPLDQCILAIIWEFLENPSHLSEFPSSERRLTGLLQNVVVLLRSAALHQARLEFVRHHLLLH